MHRFFSSAGLWPTLVSVLALFVHPLLFHLFSFHLHHLLLLLLPVDSRLSPSLSEMGRLLGLCTHTPPLFFLSSCFLFFFFFTPLCLLPVCVCSLSYTSSDHSASTPDSSFPCLLAVCFNMSVVFLLSSSVRSEKRCFSFNTLRYQSINLLSLVQICFSMVPHHPRVM